MEVEELISSSSSGCSAPAPALLSKKRKSETESLSVGGSLTACLDDMLMSDAAVADTSLSEQIKRFRLSNSPGFLRLKSDLQSYDGSAALLYSYRFPDEPDAVILHFSDDPRCPAPVPPVPRYPPPLNITHPLNFESNPPPSGCSACACPSTTRTSRPGSPASTPRLGSRRIWTRAAACSTGTYRHR